MLEIKYWTLCLSWIVSLTLRSASSQGEIDFKLFLDDDQWNTNIPRLTPILIGGFPYECIDNVNVCQRGFTFSLWYNPGRGNSQVPHQYILSSGGQSPNSEGVFLRQNYGKEYEVGVASGTILWHVSFHLIVGAWTNVAFTWNLTDGLRAYVDGMPAGVDAVGSARVFWMTQFNPFSTVFVGKANDEEDVNIKGQSMLIWHIIHANVTYDAEQLGNFVTNVSNSLLLACSSSPPGFVSASSGVISSDDLVTHSDVGRCRFYCASKRFNLVMFHASQLCLCVDRSFYLSWSANSGNWANTACSGAEPYVLLWATRLIWDPVYPINLSVAFANLSSSSQIRPNETVLFMVKESADETVTFYFDFKDGETLETMDHLVGYSWMHEGVFPVNITAVTRTTVETVIREVVITYVAEGVAPQSLLVKADPNADVTSHCGVDIFVSAFSLQINNCTLIYGDQNFRLYPSVPEFVFEEQEHHQYQGIGYYNVSLQCSNEFGLSDASAMASSVNPLLLYENVAFPSTISVPFLGIGDIRMMVDGNDAQKSVSVLLGTVGINKDAFSSFGEHLVLLQTSYGLTFYKKVYNLMTAVDGLSVLANPVAAEIGQNISFLINIAKGGGVHVNVSFGDGFSSLLYLQVTSLPVSLVQTHSYLSLGKFDLTVTIANDVSQNVLKDLLSIERPIENAVMYGSNVTSLTDLTTFTFEIDLNKIPAMPVSVIFDYDDGNIATVMLGSQNLSPAKLVHSYLFGKYGIYRVKAIVKNNISSVVLPPVIIHVGENITMVDVFVKESIVAVSQDVTFIVRCVTGSPILLEMDMGDGYPAVVKTRPSTYTNNDNKIYHRLGEGNMVSNRSLTRPKRQTHGEENDFTVVYQYKSPGKFTVRAKVSNVFSSAASLLCPGIVVVLPRLPTPSCSLASIRVLNSSTPSSPLTINRSQLLVISTHASLQCSGSAAGVNFTPGYTWTAERLMNDGIWRPELQVCASNIPLGSLAVNGNTLWYGKYRLNVTMIVNSLSGSGSAVPTLIKSTSVSTFIMVQPTALVASIANTDKDFSISSIVTINMSGSHDPDVDPGNKTGISLFLFCYTTASSAVYRTLSLQQMLDRAHELGANLNKNARIFHFSQDPCFLQLGNIWVIDFEATFPANQLTTDDSVNFRLFVTKDVRVNSTVFQLQVWPTNVSASALDSVDEMLRRGNTNAALLVINLVAGTLDGGNYGHEEVKQERTDLRGKLINCLDKVSNKLQNIDQLGKTTEVMASVTSNPEEVTSLAKANASNALGRTASKAMEFADSASPDKLYNITGSLMNGVGNILPFASDEMSNETNANPNAHSRRRRSILSALKKNQKTTNETMVASCCEALDGLCDWIEPVSCLDERDHKNTNWTEYDCELKHPDDIKEVMARYTKYLNDQVAAENALKKTITTNGMGACSNIGSVLLSKQTDGASVSINSPKMNLSIVKLDPNQEPPPSNDYQIPSSVGGCGAMAMNSPNPFTYSSVGDQVNGNVKTLLLTSCDGLPIKVEDSTEPFTLWMDGAKEEPEMKKFTIISAVSNDGINYHRITVTENNTAILIIVKPVEADQHYTVFLKYEGFPNETYFDWIGEVPIDIKGDENDNARFTVFPPQNVTSLNGTYRFGLKLKSDLENVDKASNSSYIMYLFGTVCRFWNETTDAWDTSGCSVGPKTTPMKTQCLCTHLTSFGGSFAVPPNTIDFNTVFTAQKFLESVPVFSTVIALIAAYLLLVVWTRRMDKADIVRWGALPLEDNLPSDSYYYQLSVYTGMRKNAGTASKPSFVLSGDDADSGIRRLADGKRKTLPTGSIYNYILSVESRLGPLTFLRIWHDNVGQGQKKGWYLDQIQVTDIQTGERFFFVCDRWLAVEEDDGMIERVIPVAGLNDLTQFKQLFSHSVRKKFSNDHMWFSVFSRPTHSSFTRVQRISCCVALLFLTMITNCMFFKAADPDHTTSVHIGPLEFTLQQIYISVVSTCIVLPPSVAIVTIFRKARPKPNSVQQENQRNRKKGNGWRSIGPGSALWSNRKQSRLQKFSDVIRKQIASFHQKSKYEEGGKDGQTGGKKKKKPLVFPWWTVFIAWALVFASVVLSGFFTILYSMQWGRQKSLDWLTTFFLSFFQSVVVVQPIKVLAFAAFLSCILKKPDVEEEDSGQDVNAIKPDEEYVNNSHLDLQEIIRMRQRSRLETSLPNMEVLKQSRENRLKELQIEAILKECMIYLFFILVLYFISYQDKDRRSFLFSQNLQTRFFSQGNPTFSNIQSYADVYAWLNNTLIAQLYTNGWYNNQPPKDWKELLQIDDHVTVRLGVARLRQLRIKENTCKVQSAFRNLITHCRSDYNWLDDDTKSYGVGWTPEEKKNDSVQCVLDIDTNDPWLYRDSVELKNSPYMGKVNSYKGGGYTFNFYRDPVKTAKKLAELQAEKWLDVRTRGLFVEFTLYNVNVNLYGSVIMLLEFLSNGGPLSVQEVKVFRLTSYVGPFGVIVILFQVIFVGFIIYFFVHMVKLLHKQKIQYFKDFWNLLEFSTMIMSIVTVAMYGMKMIFGNVAMDVLKESGSGKYVNFVSIGVWNEMYGFILAMVVFLSTIKFINMLKFNRRLSMLTETIKVSTKDLKAFVITFFIYFFAFSQLGYLLFCTQIPSYSSFANTIQVLFCLILGQPGFVDMQMAQEFLGPVFYFLYTWFIVFGMQSMFLCIICEAFQFVRKDIECQKNDYEVVDYLVKKVKGLFGLK